MQHFLLDHVMSVDQYRSALKSDDIVNVMVAKLIFLGPSMQGKTVTRHRLTKAIKNISSSSFDKSNTGVSEQSTVIICKDMLQATAIAKDDGEWMTIDIEKEILFCLNVLRETQVISHTEHAVSVPVVNSQHVKEVFTAEEPCDLSAEEPCDLSTSTNTQHNDQVLYEKEKAHPTSAELSAVSVEWGKEVLSDLKFRKKYCFDPLKKKLNKGCLLYMQDTGGQPELMECLPVLTIGPALYLLFCNLNSRLSDKYLIGYRGPDGTPLPNQSHFTVKETLLSALASIALMGYSSTDQITDIEQQLDNKRECVYLIGTHRDEVTNMEAIDQFESEFKETLLSTYLYKENLIKEWYEDDFLPNVALGNTRITPRRVYPLDNMFGEDKEIDYLRSSINERLNRLCANKKKIPTTWLIFGIFLRRREESHITLDCCFELGLALSMTEKTTRAVLHFLHYDIGICMHFSYIPALKNIVIPNTQSIYKNLTMLIEVAFKPSKVGTAAAEKFKKEGQFSIEEFQGASDYTLPLNILVEILQHLNIVALVCSKSVEKTMFFMPCVLQNASDEEITKFQEENPMPLVLFPLFVRYECGFVPLGVFSSMIANLMQNASQIVSCILIIL